MHRINNGFTLIELAIVLFILGLLLASFLGPLAARVEQGEREETQLQLDNIKEILYGYVIKNAHFPCPDTDNDGFEDTTDGTGTDDICAAEMGNLPWATLGVSETDTWLNRLTYRVDEHFADRETTESDGTYDVGPPVVHTECQDMPDTLSVSFSLCSDGNIKVFDSDGGAKVAEYIPAIVVSHGKNWVDNAPTAHESENIDDDITFVDKDYSDDATEGFDDMLIWISPYVLRNRMLMSGLLP